MKASIKSLSASAAIVALALFSVTAANAQLAYAPTGNNNAPFNSVMTDPDDDGALEVAPHLRRQVVSYSTNEAAGTIVVDTPNTYLYYVLGGGKAVRYGIGVGREGFTWSGVQKVARKAEWPDWNPPAEMIERQPYLPRFMAGGEGNPLGARAMYLGNTIYRIHGTNAPSTIGKNVSSGCIRMLNEDVTDLYARVQLGTKVVVLPEHGGRMASRAQDVSSQAVVATRAAAPAPRGNITVSTTQNPSLMTGATMIRPYGIY